VLADSSEAVTTVPHFEKEHSTYTVAIALRSLVVPVLVFVLHYVPQGDGIIRTHLHAP